MSVKKLKRIKATPTSRPDVGSLIMPLSQMPDYSSTLLYGESGTGKTALSGTWPKKMLVLDIAEKGTKTIKKVPGIEGILVQQWEQLEDIYWYLYDGKGKGKYKTVSLDQISQLQDLAIDKVRRDKNMKDTEPMSQRLWGQASGLMKTWLFNYRELQELGTYMVFIAHQRQNGGGDDVEENQIEPSIGARLMPSVAGFINGAVSVIGNTFIRERYVKEGKEKIRKVEYCLRVGPHSVYRSKIRMPPDTPGGVPDVIVNPTFEKIESIARGESITKRKK
jgi:hypothetical protein